MSSQHIDPDLSERISAAYGCSLPDHDARRMLSAGDRDDLDARIAAAYGCPAPDQAARKLLSLGEASSMRFAVVGDTTTDTDGAPIQRYRKDLIRVGQFVHPTEGWTLDVTADRLAKWLLAFQRMRANGVDVEITSGHSDSAESIRGYLTDMFIEGTTLMGVVEMRGEKGIELAETVKNVSVEIQDPFEDGKGNNYGEVITAIAIGMKPVVPDQQPFRRAASLLVA